MKMCNNCDNNLCYTEFNKDDSKFDGHQSRCRKCDKETKKRYYDNNKQNAYQKLKERRIKNRKIIKEMKKSNACVDCNRFYPHYIMHYDHLRDKDKAVSDAVRDWGLRRILAEVQKCDLVCSNCHAIRTHQRQFGLSDLG